VGTSPATIALTTRGCGHLAELRKRSGLPDDHAVCRWALRVSLADPNPPDDVTGPAAITLRWQALVGDDGGELDSLIDHHQALSIGRDTAGRTRTQTLLAHLERGLSLLADAEQLPPPTPSTVAAGCLAS
jgi:DNA sulfur modification protein DndE